MPFIFKHERKALRGSIHQRFSHFLYDEEVVELLVGYQFQIFIKVIISEVRPDWLSEFVCNELRMETNRRIFRRMRFSPTADGRNDRYRGIQEDGNHRSRSRSIVHSVIFFCLFLSSRDRRYSFEFSTSSIPTCWPLILKCVAIPNRYSLAGEKDNQSSGPTFLSAPNRNAF